MNHLAETGPGSLPEVRPKPQGFGVGLAVQTVNGNTVNRLQFNLVKLVATPPLSNSTPFASRSFVTPSSQGMAGNPATKGAGAREKRLIFNRVKQVDFSPGNNSIRGVLRATCEAALSCESRNGNVGV